MTARSRHRGHRIEWVGHKWVFTDWSDNTVNRCGRERPCTACGKRSRERGPDTCLGMISQVRQACCGHGHPEDAYFIFHNGVELRGADAVRLQECWIHNNVTPHDVIEVYLAVRNVEIAYRLCQMGNIGVFKLAEVLRIIDNLRRNSLDIAPFCDILEVYSNPNPETNMNTKAITNIQRQMDILSDGHQEVVDQAVSATGAIVAMDDRVEQSKESGNWSPGKMCSSRVSTQLNTLKDQLRAQAARALRACAEIEQIQLTLKIE